MPEEEINEAIKALENDPPLAVLAEDMEAYAYDPYGWVMYSFPWGEEDTELAEYDGPDEWQEEVLKYIGERLRAGVVTVHEVIRAAISAGNGPGKSALVSWLILWSMSTYADTRGVVTANTDTQLRTKTWAELAKWFRLCICKHWFTLTATAIYAKDKEHERTWRIDQIPWSKDNVEAFAGLHNKGKRLLLIFDEASSIIDTIWETAEGAMTDKDTEIIWAVFGNPTRNTGRFRQCWGNLRHRWRTWQIDTRKSKLVNQEEVKKWIEDLGLDSDWVKVHVLGKFPSASDMQFISNELAENAAGKRVGLHEYFYASRIITADPAWTGGDEIVIGLRQGVTYTILKVLQRSDDDKPIADAIATFEDAHKADAVFIDQGYGTGIYSFGKHMNRKWILVNFGSKSGTPGFANKRSEMWGKMKQWLLDGGCIPNDPKMIADLVGPEAYPNLQDKIVLESKKSMKNRGLASPGRGDALALSFAYPVKPKPRDIYGQPKLEFAKSNYKVI